ncbi:MAG: hypothetical protein PHS37_05110, partial [Candidatus Omnitrophica bacterium]|nr:hypothetical protein [Candidatus Omnitrophota bacterium]
LILGQISFLQDFFRIIGKFYLVGFSRHRFPPSNRSTTFFLKMKTLITPGTSGYRADIPPTLPDLSYVTDRAKADEQKGV